MIARNGPCKFTHVPPPLFCGPKKKNYILAHWEATKMASLRLISAMFILALYGLPPVCQRPHLVALNAKSQQNLV
jgi:hypothetical protein